MARMMAMLNCCWPMPAPMVILGCALEWPGPATGHKRVSKGEGGVSFISPSPVFVSFSLCCKCGLGDGAIVNPAGMVSLAVGTCGWFSYASFTGRTGVVM